ncbi:hypothetical protein FMJ23_31485 [Klebsiella michiganensis]|nr:hypothetical protein [Klebsiella michiganensis]MBZ7423179.1 hypothetical protein [Klebsiella michiganensis]
MLGRSGRGGLWRSGSGRGVCLACRSACSDRPGVSAEGICECPGFDPSPGHVSPFLQGARLENGIYGHSRFCNTDFDDKLACLNLSGV